MGCSFFVCDWSRKYLKVMLKMTYVRCVQKSRYNSHIIIRMLIQMKRARSSEEISGGDAVPTESAEVEGEVDIELDFECVMVGEVMKGGALGVLRGGYEISNDIDCLLESEIVLSNKVFGRYVEMSTWHKVCEDGSGREVMDRS